MMLQRSSGRDERLKNMPKQQSSDTSINTTKSIGISSSISTNPPLPPFDFATAQRIIFGVGKVQLLSHLVEELILEERKGKKKSKNNDQDNDNAIIDEQCRILIVTGKSDRGSNVVMKQLLGDRNGSIVTEVFHVDVEPTIAMAMEGVNLGKEINAEVVIGIGGGAAIDCGKAIAMLLTNDGGPYRYLEVIGEGSPITNPSIPYIAIPTTAGTGAEVTRNAVLRSEKHRVKVSLRNATMLPRIALVDPNLTLNVPPHITASTGLDAFTQVLEPYVSNLANPMTDAFCLSGLRSARESLLKCYEHGEDVSARSSMCMVSLWGGLALANAKLGAVHGFAGPIGGMCSAPHGMICAALLPLVMETNVKALRKRDPQNVALGKYEEIARLLTLSPTATIEEGVEWVKNLCKKLKVQGLRELGVEKSQFSQIIEKSMKSSSMKGNPIILTQEELMYILEEAF